MKRVRDDDDNDDKDELLETAPARKKQRIVNRTCDILLPKDVEASEELKLEEEPFLSAEQEKVIWDQQQEWEVYARSGDYQSIIKLYAQKPEQFEEDTIGLYTYLAPTLGGKTQAMKNVLFQQYHAFDDIYVWAKNEWEFANIQPDDRKRKTDFGDGRLLNGIMMAMIRRKARGLLSENYRVCLILDDQIDSPGFHDNKILNRLAIYGRHINMCVHITTQRPTKVNPCVRCNTLKALLFFPDIDTGRMFLNDFSGNVRDAKLFRNTLDHYTRHYGIIVFNRLDHSGLWQKQLHYFKSRPIEDNEWEEKLVEGYGEEQLMEFEMQRAKRDEEMEKLVNKKRTWTEAFMNVFH